MKLYATVTSERASKGQGGSKNVEILLQIDPKLRTEIGRVVMNCEGDSYKVYYYPINENCADQTINSGRVLLYETKDKKRHPGPRAECSSHLCNKKGEKQKGEHAHVWGTAHEDGTKWCSENGCEATLDSSNGIIQ